MAALTARRFPLGTRCNPGRYVRHVLCKLLLCSRSLGSLATNEVEPAGQPTGRTGSIKEKSSSCRFPQRQPGEGGNGSGIGRGEREGPLGVRLVLLAQAKDGRQRTATIYLRHVHYITDWPMADTDRKGEARRGSCLMLKPWRKRWPVADHISFSESRQRQKAEGRNKIRAILLLHSVQAYP